MADDDAPLTSYSDPFYDRLDALSRQVRRQWWLFVLAIVIIALAAIALRLWLHREPIAMGGALAVQARDEADDARREALWRELADGSAYDPAFRAAAGIELCQIQLARGDAIKAREQAQRAEEQARAAKDDDLVLAAGLSRAAAVLDSGDAAAALGLYERAARGAGAKHPARKLAAELGAAHCLDRLGRPADAIARLEPLSTRSDEAAKDILDLATAMYWRLKRAQVERPAPAPAPPEAKPEAAPAPAPAPAPPVAPAPPEAKPEATPAPAPPAAP